jgi:hypothetical protein
MRSVQWGTAAVLASLGLASQASAITIVLDYSHAAGTFLEDDTTGPVAKAAIAAAAADLSAAITTSLNATTDTSIGSGPNGASSTFDLNLRYTNPTTGFFPTIYNGGNAALAADEVRIFVGARLLAGELLGEGGPGSFGYSAGVAGGFSISDQQAAVTSGAAAATNNLLRGGGPTIGTINGTFDSPPAADPYPHLLSVGSTLGNLWFDTDTDWHYDHTTDVPDDKYDLYSVALHELLHSLGIGASESWDDLRSGNDWAGTNVAALLGTGVDVLNPAGDHIVEGMESTRLIDGVLQEAVMDPTLEDGTRKKLTQLDLAFLRDINWDTVPEPGSLMIFAIAPLFFGRRRRVG